MSNKNNNNNKYIRLFGENQVTSTVALQNSILPDVSRFSCESTLNSVVANCTLPKRNHLKIIKNCALLHVFNDFVILSANEHFSFFVSELFDVIIYICESVFSFYAHVHGRWNCHFKWKTLNVLVLFSGLSPCCFVEEYATQLLTIPTLSSLLNTYKQENQVETLNQEIRVWAELTAERHFCLLIRSDNGYNSAPIELLIKLKD